MAIERDGPTRRARRRRSLATRNGPPVSAGARPSRMRVGVFADRCYCQACTAKKIDGRCPRCER